MIRVFPLLKCFSIASAATIGLATIFLAYEGWKIASRDLVHRAELEKLKSHLGSIDHGLEVHGQSRHCRQEHGWRHITCESRHHVDAQ
jgi:hypothetical protein